MTERYHTRVLAVVHSHIKDRSKNGVVDVSADITNLNVSKSVKGSGGFSFTLVPRKNYFNYIFPNDIVNIYIDPGDGKSGYIRTMFGYVDRIERSEAVQDNGQMTTQFTVTGTDFVKVIDQTQIYFNPNLANRTEFLDKTFGQNQLGGGHALRTTGIVAHGTPAQFLENMLQLLLGFGTQWMLPTSYPTANFVDKTRSHRATRAKNLLPKEIQKDLMAAFGVSIDDIVIKGPIEEQILKEQKNVAFGPAAEGEEETFTAKQSALSSLLAAKSELAAYQAIVNASKEGSAPSIMDVLTLDFIEALAVDGYISSSSVWSSQGSLSSILYGWVNEVVNELCFDLRPVANGDQDQCFGTGEGGTVGYSTAPDELGYNAKAGEIAAVQYRPSVVLREYPFSVVDGLDLSNFTVLGNTIGQVRFGPVFALEPGKPGRKVYQYPSPIVPEPCAYADTSKPQKHIDVVTIVNTDVVESSMGRSDHDIFNLFSLYSNDVLAQNWKFLIQDFLPILTPISIARHGLRVRELNTKFANYPRDLLCSGSTGSGVDTSQIRRNLVRWTLLIDHWNQHNIEFLSGSISMRGRPDIRVGYRLDWVDRNESYYVESVQHQWQYPGAMRTTVQVSRGQRNDPFPSYIMPTVVSNTAELSASVKRSTILQNGGGNRSSDGRLADFFNIRDTRATANAVGGEAKFSDENTMDKRGNQQYGSKGSAAYANEAIQDDTIPVKDQIADVDVSSQPKRGGQVEP